MSVRNRFQIDTHQTALGVLSGVIALLVALPLFWIGYRAFQVEAGMAWDLLTRSQTVDIVIMSVGLMAFVTAFSILIGVPIAFLTTRTDLPYKRFWTIVAALPLVIPSYIGAFAFVSAFGPHGEIGDIFGFQPPAIDGFSGAVLIITLYTYPYVFLTTRAALLSLDASLIEAARTLNASRWEAFRRVILPQIRPAIGAGALLVALYAISDFGTPAFMRLEVFTSAIFWEYNYNVEYAALLSLQLITIVAMILVIEAGISQEEDAAGGGGRGAKFRLGAWKWPAMGGMGLLGFVTLVVPVAIFGMWLFRGTGTHPQLAFEWGYAFNSVYLAMLAMIVASAFAIPVAYYSVRSSSIAGRVFERVTYIGFAVPGIVIGLALVFFGLWWDSIFVLDIYLTVPLLVFAYVVRFLPQAVGTVRSSMLQVDEQLLEASRSLNAGRLETFRRVTLPLIAPGVIAGGALVFLTTMKELPATLMLQPLGMETLVTIIWAAHAEVFYGSAAIPALILILISGISMLVLLYQEDYGM